MKAVFTKVAANPHLLADTSVKRGEGRGREERGGEGRGREERGGEGREKGGEERGGEGREKGGEERGGEGEGEGTGRRGGQNQIHKGLTQCSLVHSALYQWTVSSTEMMQ